MAEIINLRTARKRRDREQKADKAAENRVLFGRTKAERELKAAEDKLNSQKLDGHKRED